ncbi:hypothetical protein QFC19_004450 [Naganishia cerealis]|uniref:Uncharacterized protein n=1 Tax=Naganishia cerealis TaxID=610337 RepID=A0ACC2VY74_9TREE|nr:hypothetical protein QFC19_004450 [Naganishia cerealis]
MHVSPLLLGVVQLTLATTSATAIALPRSRARRTHSADFIKLRTPPSQAERFVVPAQPVSAVVVEKREVAAAEVYRRPTAADDSSSSSEPAVPVSTDSINTSSGKNTQQPDLNLDSSEASSVVASLAASTSVFETFTYSAYSVQATPSSSDAPSSASPSASTLTDPIQKAREAAASYAKGQNGVISMPTVTVNLVMEPTQEVDGSWDYVVRVGGDGTATASPTWISATATATATPSPAATGIVNDEAPTSASATDYYVPAYSSVGEQVSAPVSSSAPQESGEYYYGNTHTYNSTTYGSETSSSDSPSEILDTTVRTLLTTSSSHAAFECASHTAYYYSADSDATQSCPGGTVCRFVDNACSPCVWPDADIWCNGKVYPWVTATSAAVESSSTPAATSATVIMDSPTSSQQQQPVTTANAVSSLSPQITTAPAVSTGEATYVYGSGFISASGETGRSAVTFTYAPSVTSAPIVPTTTEQPVEEPTSSSYFYGSGYASASGETGRSAITFTYSASASGIASETVSPSAAESTAWTSGHGQQHAYPWMTASVTEAVVPTATTQIESSASVTVSTTLSNGIVIATLAPAQSSQASTTINSWLVEATKGIDPVYGQPSSVTSSSAAVSTDGSISTQIESASSLPFEGESSAVSSFYPSMSATESALSASLTSSAESAYITDPAPTFTPGLSFNETSGVATSTSAGETATVTASLTSITQSANEESASGVSSTASGASSSSGIFSSSQIASSTLPTASVTSSYYDPVITASPTASSTEDPSDNGIATETVTDWDIVNATSTTFVPYESASATSVPVESTNATLALPTPTQNVTESGVPTVAPSSTAGHNASTTDFVIPDEANSTLTASVTASAEPTLAFTSPILHQWPANETSTEIASLATASASVTDSAWESAITATASSTSTQVSQPVIASDASSAEYISSTATATSSAAESTETGADEEECDEWEEVWVNERDIQDDWIIVE